MRTAILRSLMLVLVVAFALAMGACAKKQKPEEAMDTSAVTETDIDAGVADSDSGKAMGLETVRYAYDSAQLDPQARQVLDSNAQIMKDRQNLQIQIEGHTDERGGIQYNIALGERRANAAKNYLVDRGVDASRMTIISYGKEKPVDPGHDESAWGQNRRANFRITQK